MNILKASAVTASATARKTLLALIILSFGYHPLLSAEYETPRSSDPVKILGARAAGPDYRVEAPVHSDGLLRIYTLNTTYGKFYVSGDTLFICSSDHSEQPLPTFDALIADYDGNKDGKLAKGELTGPFAEHFGWLDSDQDGVVVREEYAFARDGMASQDFGMVAIDLAGQLHSRIVGEPRTNAMVAFARPKTT